MDMIQLEIIISLRKLAWTPKVQIWKADKTLTWLKRTLYRILPSYETQLSGTEKFQCPKYQNANIGTNLISLLPSVNQISPSLPSWARIWRRGFARFYELATSRRFFLILLLKDPQLIISTKLNSRALIERSLAALWVLWWFSLHI